MRTSLLVAAIAMAASAAAPTRTADSPLADAAMRGDTARVRILVQQHVNVNAAQGDGMTALHWAAKRGDLAAARLLIGAGAKVDLVTRNGAYTPLHLAAKEGRAA